MSLVALWEYLIDLNKYFKFDKHFMFNRLAKDVSSTSILFCDFISFSLIGMKSLDLSIKFQIRIDDSFSFLPSNFFLMSIFLVVSSDLR